MLRRIGIIIIAALVLVSLASSPGSAKSRVVRDKPGDSRNGALDIRAVKFGNAKRAIRVKARFARRTDLPHDCVTVAFGRKGRKGYNAIACSSGSGKRERGLFRATSSGGLKRVKCRGMRAKWNYRKPALRIKVPRRCVHRVGKRRTMFRLYTASLSHPKRKGDRTRTVGVRRG